MSKKTLVWVAPRGNKFVVLVNGIQEGPEYASKAIADQEKATVEQKAMYGGDGVGK